MRLSEFILARVAEDEARANNVLVFTVRPNGMPGNVAIPDRVMRQCEAIRTIVAEHHEALDQAQRGDMSGKIAEFAFGLTLSHLAGIWSDHPDFRAWAK